MTRPRGEPPFEPTPGELRVLRAYLWAGTINGAADALGVHPGTVKSQLSSIRSRLGCKTTAQVVLKVYEKLVA